MTCKLAVSALLLLVDLLANAAGASDHARVGCVPYLTSSSPRVRAAGTMVLGRNQVNDMGRLGVLLWIGLLAGVALLYAGCSANGSNPAADKASPSASKDGSWV